MTSTAAAAAAGGAAAGAAAAAAAVAAAAEIIDPELRTLICQKGPRGRFASFIFKCFS